MLLFTFLLFLSLGATATVPRIAVLTAPSITTPHEDYVPAAYIDWLQAAGAIAVPIPSGVYWDTSTSDWSTKPANAWTDQQYEQTFRSVNGLLLPGGNPWVQVASPALRHLLQMAVDANLLGEYFPVFGICAGMETLAAVFAGGCQSQITDGNIPTGECGSKGPVTRGFDAKNLSLGLEWTTGAEQSRMFKSAPLPLLSWLQNQQLTFNYHSGGITPANFSGFTQLNSSFSVLSTSTDRQGTRFVSTMEGRTLPFYGVQWHPAKAMFEWGVKDNHSYEAIDHSPHAIAAAQYMAEFFVAEARKSTHAYVNQQAAIEASIFNYAPSVYNSSKPMYTRTFHFDWLT